MTEPINPVDLILGPEEKVRRTKAEAQLYRDMIAVMKESREEFEERMLKIEHIPPEWRDMDRIAPVKPKKTKLTIHIDEDVVRFFRKLGRGYQGRINAVLRAYMLAVTSREIRRREVKVWEGWD